MRAATGAIRRRLVGTVVSIVLCLSGGLTSSSATRRVAAPAPLQPLTRHGMPRPHRRGLEASSDIWAGSSLVRNWSFPRPKPTAPPSSARPWCSRSRTGGTDRLSRRRWTVLTLPAAGPLSTAAKIRSVAMGGGTGSPWPWARGAQGHEGGRSVRRGGHDLDGGADARGPGPVLDPAVVQPGDVLDRWHGSVSCSRGANPPAMADRSWARSAPVNPPMKCKGAAAPAEDPSGPVF
jgi:hypothetical protein